MLLTLTLRGQLSKKNRGNSLFFFDQIFKGGQAIHVGKDLDQIVIKDYDGNADFYCTLTLKHQNRQITLISHKEENISIRQLEGFKKNVMFLFKLMFFEDLAGMELNDDAPFEAVEKRLHAAKATFLLPAPQKFLEAPAEV